MSDFTPSYSISFLAEKLLTIEGKPMKLDDGYAIYKDIYDCSSTSTLLKNARQTGKTITVAVKIAIKSGVIPFHKSLYVSPSEGQTIKFSHTKLSKMISGSKVLSEMFRRGATDNVYLKVASNGSEISLSYANADPDRIRGVSADDVIYDEIQDMDLLQVTTVVGSCTDASLDPREHFSGTPKSLENGLEVYWRKSSQTEPLIHCDGCNAYNKPGLKNIGLKGFICAKCGKLLSVRAFKWVDFNSKYRTKGFHIPQIVMPLHTEMPEKWAILLDRYDTWPRSKFMNEIMAESDSVGTRLIERSDLECLCQDYSMSYTPDPEQMRGISFTVGGVDWSGGGSEGISRTVLHIWGGDNVGTIKTLFYKVYPSEDPEKSVMDVAMLLQAYNVKFVLGDRGEGALANGILAQQLGRHRVGQFYYGSGKLPLRQDADTGIYMLDKTTVIDNYFKAIKDKKVIFPVIHDSKTMFDDIMNEFSEVTRSGKKVWTHSPSLPDDCLHAQVGGWLAAKLLRGDLFFY
jgi:hypothetical protein